MSREFEESSPYLSQEAMQAALTYLSHEGEIGKKRRRAAATNGVHQRILATAMWIVDAQFKLATQPTIQDLSDERFRTIAFMNAYRYVYDPVEMNCNTRVSINGQEFLRIFMTYKFDGDPFFSQTYLTGRKGHLVKYRISLRLPEAAAVDEAEKFIEEDFPQRSVKFNGSRVL